MVFLFFCFFVCFFLVFGFFLVFFGFVLFLFLFSLPIKQDTDKKENWLKECAAEEGTI